jgi:signal peptidase I
MNKNCGKNSGAGLRRKNALVARAVVGAFIVALIVKFFILDFMIAEGDSMIPSVKPGTVLPVCKIVYGLRVPGSGAYLVRWRTPKKDDIVVFYTPLGEIAVKRCGEIYPEDFYALGDNGPLSYDSRNYGPVSNDNIIGKVLGIK